MPKAASSIVQANTSFTARVGGIDVPVVRGDLADADSEIARKYPGFFDAVIPRFAAETRVEAATAAPGEKRGAR